MSDLSVCFQPRNLFSHPFLHISQLIMFFKILYLQIIVRLDFSNDAKRVIVMLENTLRTVTLD